MTRCPRAETRARPEMPHWAPKCLQQEPIQCPLCLPWGWDAECQCLAQGLLGASLQLTKITRSSHGAAGQNWPLPSRTPQPGRRTSGAYCNQGDRTPEAPWGSQQEGTEGLGKPERGRGALGKGTGDPILLWAGGGQETEPCYAWESRIFIQGEGVTEQG